MITSTHQRPRESSSQKGTCRNEMMIQAGMNRKRNHRSTKTTISRRREGLRSSNASYRKFLVVWIRFWFWFMRKLLRGRNFYFVRIKNWFLFRVWLFFFVLFLPYYYLSRYYIVVPKEMISSFILWLLISSFYYIMYSILLVLIISIIIIYINFFFLLYNELVLVSLAKLEAEMACVIKIIIDQD